LDAEGPREALAEIDGFARELAAGVRATARATDAPVTAAN